jgi:preprotein translocase subunit YajC
VAPAGFFAGDRGRPVCFSLRGWLVLSRGATALTLLSSLLGFWPALLAQAQGEAGKAADKGAKGAEGGGGIFDALFATPMFPVMLTLLLLYFLFMRPDPRKKKEAEQMLANLKVNDHVVTIGGICGVVVNKDESTVTIRVDDKSGAKIRVLRTAISRIGSPDEAAQQEAKEAK